MTVPEQSPGGATPSPKNTGTMPVLFLGHGSPMNALEQNEFSLAWQKTAQNLPLPTAILCISAHWQTAGTQVTAMPKPRTIHDFGGFPQELYEVQYPAPGSPGTASETQRMLNPIPVGPDYSWGLDHGAWSVIRNLYPKADVPVIQLSIDYTREARFHLQMGQMLAGMRKQGILILGSGNLVHNLGRLEWDKPDSGADWAIEANHLFKELILSGDFERLAHYRQLGKAVDLAVPTVEHFLPLLYVLGAASSDEPVSIFNDKEIMGSLAMTSVQIG